MDLMELDIIPNFMVFIVLQYAYNMVDTCTCVVMGAH